MVFSTSNQHVPLPSAGPGVGSLPGATEGTGVGAGQTEMTQDTLTRESLKHQHIGRLIMGRLPFSTIVYFMPVLHKSLILHSAAALSMYQLDSLCKGRHQPGPIVDLQHIIIENHVCTYHSCCYSHESSPCCAGPGVGALLGVTRGTSAGDGQAETTRGTLTGEPVKPQHSRRLIMGRIPLSIISRTSSE